MHIRKFETITWDKIDKGKFASRFDFNDCEGEVKILCPFHNDKNPSLSFNFTFALIGVAFSDPVPELFHAYTEMLLH